MLKKLPTKYWLAISIAFILFQGVLGQSIDYSTIRVFGNNFKGYSSVNTLADSSRFFLIGEKHRKKGNYPMFLKTWKYLNRTHQYNHVIIEYGPAMSWLINRFIAGDQEAYKILTDYVYAEDDFFMWLRELKKFSKRKKTTSFRVEGVDIELQEPLALKVLTMQHGSSIPPKEITSILTEMETLVHEQKINRVKYQVLSLKLIGSFFSNKALFKKYLGDRFDFYERVVKGIDFGLQYRKWRLTDINKAYHYREHYLFQNILKMLENDPAGKFMAQVGQVHVLKNEMPSFIKLKGWESITHRLLERSIKVASGIYVYGDQINDFDRQLLGVNLLDQIIGIQSSKNMLIRLDQIDNKSGFDFVFFNAFPQIEEIPTSHPDK